MSIVPKLLRYYWFVGIFGNHPFGFVRLKNLVTLEANINRSVKDDISKKVKQYPNSKFASIKEILNQCPSMEWTVDNIKNRKDAKMEKIKDWLGRKE